MSANLVSPERATRSIPEELGWKASGDACDVAAERGLWSRELAKELKLFLHTGAIWLEKKQGL